MMDRGFKRGELVLISSKPKIDLAAQGYLEPVKKVARRAILQATYHYAAINKIGFPTGFRCWCGQQIMFRYGEHGILGKRKKWFDQHDLCEHPKGGKP